MNTNADPGELAKFSALAHRWWDPTSDFKPLHDINPLRLDYIDARCGGLKGKTVLDVGCGGGILAEAMARAGATVTAIDLSEKALSVAKLHQLESGIAVDYRFVAVETLADEIPGVFDVVTCMELLEHVPQPGSTVAACARLTKPGGNVFCSTINRNAKSYLFAIIGAEYILNLLPRGARLRPLSAPVGSDCLRAQCGARSRCADRHDLQPADQSLEAGPGYERQLHRDFPPR